MIDFAIRLVWLQITYVLMGHSLHFYGSLPTQFPSSRRCSPPAMPLPHPCAAPSSRWPSILSTLLPSCDAPPPPSPHPSMRRRSSRRRSRHWCRRLQAAG
ncbi:hypothetical protein PVAP13_4NG088317 [Panicum virgatum]|uniref:Uncharacterized protein n=1 Tax=Panicum virgatum TaxID=38727 RepID=A0A8T0TBX6_PANVG|nr:hypothetical protein PVAP13_4NG088317 [Panicum virgatum]